MTPFDAYLAPARTSSGLWRMLLGIFLIAGMWLLAVVVIFFAIAVVGAARTGSLDDGLLTLQGIEEGGDPVIILIMLATFSGIWLGVFMTLLIIHGQRFATIFAPPGAHATRPFLKGLIFGAVLAALSLIPAIWISTPFRSALDLSDWMFFLAPLALLVFVQVTAEELFFRGYLIQQIATRWTSPIIWGVLPALIFGAFHYGNADTTEGGLYYATITFLVGLTFAVLVWRAGSLWPAIGMHLAVNISGLAVIGGEGILSGTQLYHFPAEDIIPIMRVDLVVTILALGFVLSPLGRVFDAAPSESRDAVIGGT